MCSKVLIADPIAAEGVNLLREQVEVDVRLGLKPEELLEIVGDYEALIVRSETKVTSEVIQAGGRLRVIARAGVGIDNVDVEAATRRGILVLNSPTGNVLSAAEFTITLLLALCRRVTEADASLKSGQWKRQSFVGTQVLNKTLGLVGLGRVGGEVARRAQGLQMRVIAFDPFLSPEAAQRLGVELLPLDELLVRADFVSLHTPLTKDTLHLIGSRELSLMKEGAMLINASRGGVVSEYALVEALQSCHLAGAALDVFEKEPPPADHPLLAMPNVITTPHLGGSTREAQVDVALDVAQQVLAALRNEPVTSAINLPPLSRERMQDMLPYVDLGGKLGQLLSQIAHAPIEALQVQYHGDLAQSDTGLITVAVIRGLLASRLSSHVTFVNAGIVARQRGIKVTERRHVSNGEFGSALEACVATSEGTRSVAGIVLPSGQARLVRIDNYRVDVELGGYMLVSSNVDRPGMIGKVGTILGNENVNVAFMQLGRDSPGKRAVSVLLVDNPVADNVLEKLRLIDGIITMDFVDMGNQVA
ncbi:MAG: phosphoglycerate dehydrogenase [Chloroflexi bacterium]|nr:phosphoglycerate dehydrogenase [Chloroflexota bacterium]MDA8188497.1 phosphoglycerate dehydrogenase [Dehalococcoidales bacterium]